MVHDCPSSEAGFPERGCSRARQVRKLEAAAAGDSRAPGEQKRPGKYPAAACLVISAFFCALAAFGDTAYLIPSADTDIFEIYPTNNVGGRTWVNAGSNLHGFRTRALFKFDIAGNLPPGSQITSASLTLSVVGIPGDGYAVSFFDLNRLLRDWGEGTNSIDSGVGSPATINEADWLSPFALTTNFWTTPGAAATNDYVPDVTASQIIYDVTQSPYYFPDPSADPSAMVADLQLWLDNPGTNFGWIFISESEDVPSTARRFGSRESSDPTVQPLLTIEYTPPALPKIDSTQRTGNQFALFFTAQPGKSYVVEYCDSLPPATWSTLTNFPPQPVVTNVAAFDSITNTARFYRLGEY